ncbi:MAG: glutamine--fructose-6-phosphate transaminase (isomerizing) [Methanomicrobiales archaeon]|nr:glutamine--fructose-6-phosphate transaminase (isomerizing) [Methanomicrobiales archaeon]MDI6876836.1 glutamine--fructose-6-phosphate transaminase (isomerizing) [Methanomicrobiales archaeon]
MCGIIGYIGRRDAAPVLIQGLRKLEYRGYDSFGIATVGSSLEVVKRAGKISDAALSGNRLHGRVGIGHTRWATHGEPNDRNAHPHVDCTASIAVVHNGIIENFIELRKELAARGHTFRSETDTEVIAHLVEENFEGDLLSAVEAAIGRLHGSYALLAIARDDPRIVAAREKSPLVLGIGDGELLAASDMTPLLEYTERVIFLEDGDVATIEAERVEIRNRGRVVERPLETVNWGMEDVKLGAFEHYMLKEIYEQPQVFYETFRSAADPEISGMFRGSSSVTVVACGTSLHAGLIFKYLLEGLCGIPVRVEFASEFKYFTPPLRELVIGVTQSGETADTLAALRKAKTYNCPTLAITNVQGSTVTRIADRTLLMRAGPEIGVAATKSFIAQIAVFMQIANALCDGELTDALSRAHLAISEALSLDVTEGVELCRRADHIFFVGRGPFYPVSLEGALKMKEISYIPAEGYAAGELKHGPFALLTPKTTVVAVCLPGNTYGVMLSNIKEMKARGAPVIALGERGDTQLAEVVDIFIPLPKTSYLVGLLTSSVVFQLLSYHTARALDRDIDKPRNLAKSVTVE